MKESWICWFPAVLPEMVNIWKAVGSFLDELQCSEKARIRIRIAVDEVFSNIVKHADGSVCKVYVR